MALTNKLEAIGDAIREKTGKTGKLTLDQMPTEIASITGGSTDLFLKSVTGQEYSVTANDLAGATEIGDSAFMNSLLRSIELPATITKIGAMAFYDCPGLTEVKLNEGLEELAGNVFQSCVALQSITLPSTLKEIGWTCCGGCTQLTTVTFKGTPQTIEDTTFISCSRLTDIYVPWAEGAVADAPWGATKATIHYNSEV